MANQETAEDIDAAAMAWVARLDREASNPASQRELEVWLNGDTRRQGAFLRAQAIWSKLDRAALTSAVLGGPVPGAITRRVAVGATVAAGAVAAGGGGLWIMLGDRPVETMIGEVRQVPLADGSNIALNTASRLHVHLLRSARNLRLDAGEAWFQVERDPTRPFVVEAGQARVRVIGTAFSVRRFGNGAEVSVSEGVVQAWVVGREPEAVRLEAGDKVVLAEAQRPARMATSLAEIDRRLAWRGGKIDLAGETLAEAASEFNRYNTRTITLADSQIANRRFFGLFRMNDPEGFARAVHEALGAPVILSENRIIIGG